MTQILTCLTPDHVVLVADRRLVNLPSGDTEDDEACKIVALGSQVALAFSGLANVRPAPRGQTDLWLADLLSPPPPRLPEIIAKIAEEATSTFSRITHLGPRAKRHAFVAAGWEAESSGPGFTAFFASVSNAEDSNGHWLDMARRDFLVRTRRIGAEPFRLEVTGQPLEGSEKRRLLDALADPANHAPSRLGPLLATAIRSTATQNPAVGKGLLGITLPASTASSDRGFALVTQRSTGRDFELDLPASPEPVAFYVPSSSNEGVVYAPHHVTPDLTIADVQIHDRALSPEEIKRKYEEGLKRRR